MADNIPFTELDFDSIKSNLKLFLSSQERFRDYNFEGSNMSVILDMLSYNTFQNNYYTNMLMSEGFLDSAQLRDSVVSHAKELNYIPKSRHSSRSLLSVALSVTGSPSFVTIPRHTQFNARCGNRTFTFITAESATVSPVSGVFQIDNLEVYEGKIVREYYNVTGDTNQKFIINSGNVDTNSIRVSVRDNSSIDSTQNEYTLKENLLGVAPSDNVFYIEPEVDNLYKITFGKDVFGVQPVVGNVVEIEYCVTVGEEANGASTFSINDKIGGYTAIVTGYTAAEGGSERESIESIKFFAPKSTQIQDRAITESDYSIILKNRFSEIQAISVYGGEELDPPQYGRVIVAIDVQNAEGVSEGNKVKYANFLRERTPLSIEPIVVSPKFMFVDVETTVNYNTKTTDKTSSDIEAAVRTAITNYSATSLEDFRKTFRYSKLTSAIDAADVNILSNSTQTRAIIAINPELNIANYFDLNFNNEIIQTGALGPNANLQTRIPSISSTSLTYNDDLGFIIDDGIGNLHIIKLVGTGFVYLERNIGTVDYTTGRVIIRTLNVSNFVGSEIKLFARSTLNNIIAPKDRIISIRPQDVSVIVNGVRE